MNIFQPLEKTADIEVTDFKFEQISHLRNSIASSNSNGHDTVNGKDSHRPSRKGVVKKPTEKQISKNEMLHCKCLQCTR